MSIQHSSRTDLWYTPLYIIDMVKQVLGSIDLDPASDPDANHLYLKNNLPSNWDGEE